MIKITSDKDKSAEKPNSLNVKSVELLRSKAKLKNVIALVGDIPMEERKAAPKQIEQATFQGRDYPLTGNAVYPVPVGRIAPPAGVNPDNALSHGTKVPWQKVPAAATAPLLGENELYRGQRYVVYDAGVLYGIRRSNNEKYKIADFTIFPPETAIKLVSDNGSAEVEYECSYVTSAGIADHIRVPKQKWDKCMEMIHKKEPRTFLINDGEARNAINEYLRDMAPVNDSTLKEVIKSKMSGWIQHPDKTFHYHMGDSGFYDGFFNPEAVVIPEERRATVFQAGIEVLRIGNYGTAICLILLYSMMAFLRFFLEMTDKGIHFGSVLYLPGPTGSFKTSTLALFAFALSDRCGMFRVDTSTWAGIRDQIALMRDMPLVIDDFKNNIRKEVEKELETINNIIRVVCDRSMSTKCNLAKGNQPDVQHIRSVVIISGEEGLQLGLSTMLRFITAPVEKGTFDREALAEYEGEKKIFIREFMVLFIQYLEENGHDLVPYFQQTYPAYLDKYFDLFSDIARFADTAAQLHLEVDVLEFFATWCGIKSFDSEPLRWAIMDGLATQKKRSEQEDIAFRFLNALFSMVVIDEAESGGGDIAPSEKVFWEGRINKKVSCYRGFLDEHTNVLYILWNDSVDLVGEYYKRRGEAYLTKSETVRRELKSKGILIPPKTKSGIDNIHKMGKKDRPYMLALNYPMAKTYLETRRM